MTLSIGILASQISGSLPPAAFLADGATAGPNGKYYLFISVGGSYTAAKSALSARNYGSSVYPWQPTSLQEEDFGFSITTTNAWMGIVKPNTTTAPFIWTYDDGPRNGQTAYNATTGFTPIYANWRINFPGTTTTNGLFEVSDRKWTSRTNGGLRDLIAEWSPA